MITWRSMPLNYIRRLRLGLRELPSVEHMSSTVMVLSLISNGGYYQQVIVRDIGAHLGTLV